MRVLVACEESATVREEFAKRGHDAWSCDILPSRIPGKHIQGDVLSVLNEGWDLMIAFPPCTFLSGVANSWLDVDKYGQQAIERIFNRHDALGFVLKLYYSDIPKVAIENPVGYLNSAFRKPDQIIHPYFFGGGDKKRTCFWLKNLKPLVHIKQNSLFEQSTYAPEPEPIYTGKFGRKIYFVDALNGADRAMVRSKTFPGIAKAMAEQWG